MNRRRILESVRRVLNEQDVDRAVDSALESARKTEQEIRKLKRERGISPSSLKPALFATSNIISRLADVLEDIGESGQAEYLRREASLPLFQVTKNIIRD